ncbi:MAG: Uma2 family endonuclease [Tildeniella nuda ZEHNDER 1965/U140]|jgi:Uma2 family endonuclease|nr:Uma2 family endonuclease [Tildeniella nuda ZEHNDER 1965/U140]
MTIAAQQPITLEEFLKLPETKPASEYINGAIIQKPMPKTRHSRLQARLISTINEEVEEKQIAYAFPELRCTFGGRSIIPDLAILTWSKIGLDTGGELLEDVFIAPDWTIEILSPEQGSNRVTGNILHCLQHGCSLGWLIDPGDRSILAFLPKQEPVLYEGNDRLPVLKAVNLELTVGQIFGWLKMSR